MAFIGEVTARVPPGIASSPRTGRLVHDSLALMAGTSCARSFSGSRLASSAPRAAVTEKAMAPVLVLPGAIARGRRLPQRFLSKRLAGTGLRPRADPYRAGQYHQSHHRLYRPKGAGGTDLRGGGLPAAPSQKG